MKYVALLRGINIGGRNKVNMKQLTEAMEASGFENVSTYINSGNLFFESNDDENNIVKNIEKVIKNEFNLDINVLIRSKENIDRLVAEIPVNWSNGDKMKCDVMFLWDKYNSESVLKELTIKPDIDNASFFEGAIIWKVDRKNAPKSGMMKLVGTDLYAHMTVRNVNTLRKIHELI